MLNENEAYRVAVTSGMPFGYFACPLHRTAGSKHCWLERRSGVTAADPVETICV
jgi:hypothetical protein